MTCITMHGSGLSYVLQVTITGNRSPVKEIQSNSFCNEDSNTFIVNMEKAIILKDIYEILVRMEWTGFFDSN